MVRGKLDKSGLEIVKLLQDGRRSFKEIAQAVGLSEATVRTKVNKMVEDGLVSIKALVSTKDMPVGYQTVLVGIRLNSPALKKTAEALSVLPGVVSVAIVTGRYDIILTVMLTPEMELIDFFNIMLEKYSDRVNVTETFLVYESVNFKTPYPF